MDIGFNLQLNIKDINRLLCAIIIFEIYLVTMYLLDVFLGMPRQIHILFNLDGEATLPSWFSSIQLFLIGMLYLLLGHQYQKHPVVNPRFFVMIGIGFLLLSMDEAAVIHEKISLTLQPLEWVPQFKGGHGIWIPVYLSIALIIVLTTCRDIISLWKEYPRQVLIIFMGLLIMFTGSVGLEVLSYWYLRSMDMLYKAEVAVEEFFEMFGASVVLYGTMLFASRDPQLMADGPPILLKSYHLGCVAALYGIFGIPKTAALSSGIVAWLVYMDFTVVVGAMYAKRKSLPQ